MKKNIFTKILSVALSLALLLSCAPNTIRATAEQENIPIQGIAEDTTTLQTLETIDVPTKTPGTIQIISEDESKRGETYKEFILNSGQRIATVYPSAIHYRENGVWKDIDNTLVAAISSGKAVYQNTAGTWNVRFPQSLSGNDMIGVTKDGYTVQFGMAGEMRSTGDLVVASIGQIGSGNTAGTLAVSTAQTAVAQIQEIDLTAARAATDYPETILDKLNSRLIYASVYPNTNVVYDLQGNQLKESVVMQQYDASLWGYRYTLDTGDLVPVLQENQQIDLCDPETNEVILTMPAPYMLDNNGEISYDVEVLLTQNGNQYLLSYYLPREWLADANRAWPVILDPEISFPGNYSNVDDITVCENYNEDMGRGVIQCGYYSPAGAMRFYMQFLQLPTIAATDVIYDATISLYKPYDSGTTANISVYKVTEAWSQSTISWAEQPIFDTTDENYVVCQLAGTYTWNITDIVSSWYETNNYGMVFKVQDAVETGTTENWKQFYSSEFNNDTATMPMLTLTYGPCSSGGGDSFSNAVALNLDSAVAVNIAVSFDKRYFKFTPSATGFYTFESSNNDNSDGYSDPRALIYNSSERLLEGDDDGSNNKNFRLTYHLDANNTYFLAVGCFSIETGAYSIGVTKPTSLTSTEATTISWGDSKYTNCFEEQETVIYKFEPTKTNEYLLYTSGTNGDPILWLYNSNLTLVKCYDDGAGNYHSRGIVTLFGGNTYYIVADQYNAHTGSFWVNILEAATFTTNTYQLQNSKSFYYMDIHGPYAQEYVHQYSRHTGLQEQWVISKGSDGYYTIRSEFGNRYYVGVSSTSLGTNNVMLFSAVSDQTKWKIYTSPIGECVFIPKNSTSAAMYAPDNNIGTELQLAYLSTTNKGVRWSLRDKDPLPSGVYMIYSEYYEEGPKVMDTAGGDVGYSLSGARIQTCALNTTRTTTTTHDKRQQLYKITMLPNGYYTIRPMTNSSLGFTVTEDDVKVMEDIGINDNNSVPLECLWNIRYDSSARVSFQNLSTGKYISITDSASLSSVGLIDNANDSKVKWNILLYTGSTEKMRDIKLSLSDSHIISAGETLDLTSVVENIIFYSHVIGENHLPITLSAEDFNGQPSFVAYWNGHKLISHADRAGMVNLKIQLGSGTSKIVKYFGVYVKPSDEDDTYFYLQNIMTGGESQYGFVQLDGTYANVIVSDATFSLNQVWQLESFDSNTDYYMIKNVYTEQYLTSPETSVAGSSVYMSDPLPYVSNGTSTQPNPRQLWIIDSAPSGSGAKRLRSKYMIDNNANLCLVARLSDNALIQGNYIANDSSRCDEFNVLSFGNEVVYQRAHPYTPSDFRVQHFGPTLDHLSRWYSGFTLAHKTVPVTYSDAIDLAENSKITIFCGHAGPTSFNVSYYGMHSKRVGSTLNNGTLYNTDLWNGTAQANLSDVDIIIFAGCEAAGSVGANQYNLAHSAHKAGAKVAIGWTELTSSALFDWMRYFFQALDDGDTVSEAKVYADSFFSDISTTSSVIYGDGSLKFN